MITREDIFRNGITLDEETERNDQKEFAEWFKKRGGELDIDIDD